LAGGKYNNQEHIFQIRWLESTPFINSKMHGETTGLFWPTGLRVLLCINGLRCFWISEEWVPSTYLANMMFPSRLQQQWEKGAQHTYKTQCLQVVVSAANKCSSCMNWIATNHTATIGQSACIVSVLVVFSKPSKIVHHWRKTKAYSVVHSAIKNLPPKAWQDIKP
jgi:hypothetical protein